jgi:hypothetical protein
MASIINASSTGSGGIVQTADASGVLQLQSNGTVALTVSGSAVTFAGSSSASSISLNGASIGDYSLYNAMVARVGNGAGIGINSANSTDNAYLYFGYGTSSPNQQGAAIGRIGGDVLSFFTAGTQRMSINSSGYVTQPYQPAFYAYMSSGGSTLFAANATFVFDTVSNNTGSNYSTSTGRFTAPVAGWYHFSTTVLGQAISGGTSWEIGLTNQTGGLGALGGRMVYQSNYTGSGGYIWACASCTVYLNVGDYMRVTNNSGASAYINSGPWACFSGHLIG